MSSGAIIGFSCIALLILLFLKVPVYGAILGSTIIYFVLQPDVTIYLIIQRMIAGIESIPLLAVPFFIAAGVFMNYTGVTKRIMDFCTVLTCKLPGGLAQVNVLLSTMMGGLSGSSLADAAMEAKMLEPEMERHGYSKPFSSAVTAFSSIITPLIPPGIAAILYGSIANLSIGKLFIAGIGPGLLLCTSMMLLCGIISKKRGYQAYGQARMDKKELGTKFRHAILPLCLPVIIIGGIRLGICTPTEAGSIAVVYSIILGVLYRELGWGELKKGLKESVLTTASVLIIVSAASAFSWILTRAQIPQKLTALHRRKIRVPGDCQCVPPVCGNVHRGKRGADRAGSAAPSHGGGLWRGSDPVCADLQFQHGHRRGNSAHGNADVYRLWHHQV